MNLTFIEDGSRLLIDTNILIYARRGMSEQCRTLLRRCSAGQLFGALTTIGLAEFCHRRMMMEAQSRGLSSSNPSRSLSEDPKLVQQLSQYSGEVADLLSEELSIIEIEAIDFPKALEIQRAHGLMTNDSLQVAAARRVGISILASADFQYEGLPGLQVFKPDDI